LSGKTEVSGVALAIIVTSTMLAAFAARETSAQDVIAAIPIKVLGHFKAPSSEKDGKARGISGMACLGKATDASRECFIINDEESFGEIATLTSDGLIATGKTIDFVEKGEKGKDIFGVARDPMCRDKKGVVEKGKFDELDGEGVAIAGDLVYVASSHSCSGGGKYKPSSFLLARFRVSSPNSFEGNLQAKVERSWRLADALLSSEVKNAYGKPKGEGTNIEGIAVIDGRLYAGLRTPVNQNVSFIVSAPINDLFAPGLEGLRDGVVETIPVTLGANTGIRDLAALDKGRLLILSGPTVEQADVDYKVWLLEKPAPVAAPHPLATITTSAKGKNGERAKAEAIAVLDETADRLKLLVLYDNIDEGEPTQYEIALPPR
jgi:hypothetical protein